MKCSVVLVALFGIVAMTGAWEEDQYDNPVVAYISDNRVRRDTGDSPGSIVIQGQKPLSGPDRRPSLDVDYQHRLIDRDNFRTNAYGGVNVRPGQAAQPHLGLNFEREYKNGFVGGFGQAQRGPGGRVDPSFGIRGGFRFRRDVDAAELEEEDQPQY